MEALGFIKNKASKDDLKRILRLEEQYMNLVEDDNKEFVKAIDKMISEIEV